MRFFSLSGSGIVRGGEFGGPPASLPRTNGSGSGCCATERPALLGIVWTNLDILLSQRFFSLSGSGCCATERPALRGIIVGTNLGLLLGGAEVRLRSLSWESPTFGCLLLLLL